MKFLKFDYKKLVWMNKEFTLLLTKSSKLTKKYYNESTDHNKNLLVNTANECTRFIVAAKEKYLIRLSAKLEDLSTAPKTYWSILNRFLSNRSILQSILNDGVFPGDWKKSNVIPCHKMDIKNLVKNYRLITLFPIFSKVYERLTYNSLYNYFIQNKLFTDCQSGFMPGVSCLTDTINYS